VQQEDGSCLCGACDLHVNGRAAKVTSPLDTLMPNFCPKCNAVWDTSSPTCAKCNWDVIALRHVAPNKKAQAQVHRIWVDPLAIALAVFFIVGGYIVFDRYQAHKAEQQREAEQAAHDAEARKVAEARAQKAREDAAKRQTEEQVKQEKEREEREHAQLVAAEEAKLNAGKAKLNAEEEAKKRAQQDAERKRQEEALKKQKEDEIAARAKHKKDIDEERRMKLAAREAMSRDQKIAEFTQELKDASESSKKATENREAAQRRMNSTKNNVELIQKQVDALERTLANEQGQNRPWAELRAMQDDINAKRKALADAEQLKDRASNQVVKFDVNLADAQKKMQRAKDGLADKIGRASCRERVFGFV
jgi:hypothetical protein